MVVEGPVVRMWVGNDERVVVVVGKVGRIVEVVEMVEVEEVVVREDEDGLAMQQEDFEGLNEIGDVWRIHPKRVQTIQEGRHLEHYQPEDRIWVDDLFGFDQDVVPLRRK